MDSIKKLPTCSRGLHLAHLNLQSICNKFDMVKYHIKELQFDIFTFSESWLTEQTTNDMLHIKGYNLLRNDRSWSDNRNRDVKVGGGVGVYLRDSISYTTKDLDRFNTSTQVIESLWVKIVNCKHRQIIVGTIYRPPTGNVHEFVDILTEQVNEQFSSRWVGGGGGLGGETAHYKLHCMYKL